MLVEVALDLPSIAILCTSPLEEVSKFETFCYSFKNGNREQAVHVISRKPFNDAAKLYPNDSEALVHVYTTLRNGAFSTPDELRRVFPSLDNFKYRDKWWVIDIGGNNLRLIAFIEFRDNRMYVKHIVSHPEYDKLTEKYRRNKE